MPERFHDNLKTQAASHSGAVQRRTAPRIALAKETTRTTSWKESHVPMLCHGSSLPAPFISHYIQINLPKHPQVETTFLRVRDVETIFLHASAMNTLALELDSDLETAICVQFLTACFSPRLRFAGGETLVIGLHHNLCFSPPSSPEK